MRSVNVKKHKSFNEWLIHTTLNLLFGGALAILLCKGVLLLSVERPLKLYFHDESHPASLKEVQTIHTLNKRPVIMPSGYKSYDVMVHSTQCTQGTLPFDIINNNNGFVIHTWNYKLITL